MVRIKMKFNQALTLLPNFQNCHSEQYIEKPLHQLTYEEDESGTEVYKVNFSESDIVINLDQLEIALSKKYQRKLCSSMDLAFVISNEDDSNAEFILVEYKFNFKNPAHINKLDLDKKVKYSSRYMKCFYPYPQHKRKYFIFKTEYAPLFKRRIRNMNPTCSPDYIICNITDLFNTFFI